MKRLGRTFLTFAMLAGLYAAYVPSFALVAAWMRPPAPVRLSIRNAIAAQSRSAKEARELALRAFGRDHWTAFSDNRYYNVERGYWMYWDKFERPSESEGKRMRFVPFAMIWKSKDDNTMKVVVAREATIDFDNPFNLLKAGPKPNVVRAELAGDVRIIDDKGKPDSPADHLVITMPYVEFSEPDMQVRCNAPVRLTDRDLDVTGRGLVIGLIPDPENRQGYPGAESIVLQQDVIIQAADVGSSNMLPGQAQPRQQLRDGANDPKPRTPLRVMCDGEMRITMPRPRRPVAVGPPNPPQPTVARFSRNVIVQRGAGVPDQINGDNLLAILVPGDPRPAAPGGEPEPADPLGGLRLREAKVDGHAVWLQSEAKGIKARGNELIYKKPKQNEADEIYFRADAQKRLWFEQEDRDEKGNLRSVATMWAIDATVFDDPNDKARSTVIARGPGQLEMRRDRDQPVERSAQWTDQLVVQTIDGAPTSASADGRPVQPASLGQPPAPAGSNQMLITLTGRPRLDDPKQATLTSEDSVVVCLTPRKAQPQPEGLLASDPAKAGTGAAATANPGQGYRIDWMTARTNVVMTTPRPMPGNAVARADDSALAPGQRRLTARERLDVQFEHPKEEAPIRPAAPAATARGGASIERVSDRRPSDEEFVSRPAATPPVEGQVTAKPEDPPVLVGAERVWAKVVLAPPAEGATPAPSTSATDMKARVSEVRLRGKVTVHQDPPAGKAKGLELIAEAADLHEDGPNRMRFQAQGTDQAPAIVSSEEFSAEGPILGLDQARDLAWVRGAGKLKGLAERGQMNTLKITPTAFVPDEPAADPKPEEPKADTRQPVTISFKNGMLFHGTYIGSDGKPGPARALFTGKVHGEMVDDTVDCDEMEAILDRTISFSKASGGGRGGIGGALGLGGGSRDDQLVQAGDNEPQPKPQIASVICRTDVRLVSIEREKETPDIRERREVRGTQVTFDRTANRFWVDERGTVLITSRDDGEGNSALPGLPGAQAGGRTVRPTAAQASSAKLMQTRIDFRDGMEGSLGTPVPGSTEGARTAQFKRDVQVLRSEVDGFGRTVDHDRRPAQFVAISADELYVEAMPGNASARQQGRSLMKAVGTAEGQTETSTIQADRITYDSATGIFYALGSQGAPVMIVNQNSPGQRPSTGNGEAVRFNPKTGQSELIGPGAFQIFRPDTGRRPNNVAPDTGVKPNPTRRRPEPRLPRETDQERKGFSGR